MTSFLSHWDVLTTTCRVETATNVFRTMGRAKWTKGHSNNHRCFSKNCQDSRTTTWMFPSVMPQSWNLLVLAINFQHHVIKRIHWQLAAENVYSMSSQAAQQHYQIKTLSNKERKIPHGTVANAQTLLHWWMCYPHCIACSVQIHTAFVSVSTGCGESTRALASCVWLVVSLWYLVIKHWLYSLLIVHLDCYIFSVSGVLFAGLLHLWSGHL